MSISYGIRIGAKIGSVWCNCFAIKQQNKHFKYAWFIWVSILGYTSHWYMRFIHYTPFSISKWRMVFLAGWSTCYDLVHSSSSYTEKKRDSTPQAETKLKTTKTFLHLNKYTIWYFIWIQFPMVFVCVYVCVRPGFSMKVVRIHFCHSISDYFCSSLSKLSLIFEYLLCARDISTHMKNTQNANYTSAFIT